MLILNIGAICTELKQFVNFVPRASSENEIRQTPGQGYNLSTQNYNQPIPFRAATVTLEQLQDLKNRWGENRSQVIIRCIERIWWDEVGSQKSSSKGSKKEEDQSDSAT